MSTSPIQHKAVKLRDIGKDERWLQTEIAQDPSILGLGDLTLFRRELKQSSGGRLDMLLVEPETEFMYEVEIMLGATDPSHIIRTIEYWDVESRRYPAREHRAVIVAEEITNRFFNVIWLLNRSIPIIAVQLNVLTVGEGFLLHFTKVLDIYEPPESLEEPSTEAVDRGFWEKRSSPQAMKIFDSFINLLDKSDVRPKLSWRQDGIALAGRYNFARITPRKQGDCLLKPYQRCPQDVMAESRTVFESSAVPLRPLSGGRFSIELNDETLERGAAALTGLVRRAMASES